MALTGQLVQLTHLPLLLAYFSVDNRMVFGHDAALVRASAVQVFELLDIHIHHLRKARSLRKGSI